MAIADHQVARLQARGAEKIFEPISGFELVVVLIDDLEVRKIERAGNVPAAGTSVALGSVVELVGARVDDGDGRLVEMAADPRGVGYDFLAQSGRYRAFRGLRCFGGHRMVRCLPANQATIENRSAVAEAQVVECPVDTRGRGHPIRSEIQNDVRAVCHAEVFEDGDELLDRRKLQHQALAVRRGNAGVVQELRAGDVAALVILFFADLQED